MRGNRVPRGAARDAGWEAAQGLLKSKVAELDSLARRR